MIIRHFLSVLFIVATLNACTGNVNRGQSDSAIGHIDIQRRIDIANSLFKQHDYHASLVQWNILRSIQPDNPEFENRVHVLVTLINRRIKLHMSKVQTAFDKKENKTAEWELLKILALDPEHEDAIVKLKRIERNRAEKKQAKKIEKILYKRKLSDEIREALMESSVVEEKENEQAQFFLEYGITLFDQKDWQGSIREIDKYISTAPSDRAAIKYLTTAHLNMSKIFEQRGHLEPAIQHMEDIVFLNILNNKEYSAKLHHLKQKLSANYYIEGVKVYRKNIDQAIRFWKQAAKVNPNNEKAKIRLRKAIKVKENLENIESN